MLVNDSLADTAEFLVLLEDFKVCFLLCERELVVSALEFIWISNSVSTDDRCGENVDALKLPAKKNWSLSLFVVFQLNWEHYFGRR